MKNSEYITKTSAFVRLSAIGITKELKKINMKRARKYSTVTRFLASFKSGKFEFESIPS